MYGRSNTGLMLLVVAVIAFGIGYVIGDGYTLTPRSGEDVQRQRQR
jgi:hypothetical protein